jgi:hypothetical protein
MMNKFRSWYLSNATEITWFLIGFLTFAGLQDLARGDHVQAAISFILVALNWSLARR